MFKLMLFFFLTSNLSLAVGQPNPLSCSKALVRKDIIRLQDQVESLKFERPKDSKWHKWDLQYSYLSDPTMYISAVRTSNHVEIKNIMMPKTYKEQGYLAPLIRELKNTNYQIGKVIFSWEASDPQELYQRIAEALGIEPAEYINDWGTAAFDKIDPVKIKLLEMKISDRNNLMNEAIKKTDTYLILSELIPKTFRTLRSIYVSTKQYGDNMPEEFEDRYAFRISFEKF